MKRALCKSLGNRKIFGVCGGIGEYLGIDPSIIRVLWIILLFVFGTGFLLYILFAIIMPEQKVY